MCCQVEQLCCSWFLRRKPAISEHCCSLKPTLALKVGCEMVVVLLVGSAIRDLREESFFMCLCVSVRFVVVAVAVFDRGGGGGLDECQQEFMQSICRRKK